MQLWYKWEQKHIPCTKLPGLADQEMVPDSVGWLSEADSGAVLEADTVPGLDSTAVPGAAELLSEWKQWYTEIKLLTKYYT